MLFLSNRTISLLPTYLIMVKYFMPKSRFLIEIELELENLSSLATEINKIVTHHDNIDPDVIVKTATASFLAQYYGGVENILKRIFKMYKFPLPKSENRI